MEVFAAVYRAELKTFGIDFVVAAAGNMRTGVPRKRQPLCACRRRNDASTTPVVRQNIRHVRVQAQQHAGRGLDAASAAKRVIELAEQVPSVNRSGGLVRMPTKCFGQPARNPTPNSTPCASRSSASAKPPTHHDAA
jgi:hypothetical protein